MTCSIRLSRNHFAAIARSGEAAPGRMRSARRGIQAFSRWKVRAPHHTASTAIASSTIPPSYSPSNVKSPRKVARSESTTCVNGLIREMV